MEGPRGATIARIQAMPTPSVQMKGWLAGPLRCGEGEATECFVTH